MCKTRLLYRAYRSKEGVAVVSLLDDKAKKDLAKHFNVSINDIEAVISEVQEGLKAKDAQRDADVLPVRDGS